MVETGKVLSSTRNVARKYKHNLVVIGLGGHADLKKVLYGSITNSLLMTSEIPVLAISKRIDYREPKKMLFAFHMKKTGSPTNKKMREFSAEIGVQLGFFHTAEPGKQRKSGKVGAFSQKIQKITKNPGAKLTIYEAPSFPEGITKFIGDDKHTILVMTRYRNKFLEWLLSNSAARSIAQIASFPLLVLPADV